MRKHMLLIAITALFALGSVASVGAAVVQEQQEQAKSVEGTLEAVDLEENTVVVKQTDESEITLVINDETVVRDRNGETTTLASLSGREGQSLTASFVETGDSNVALSIQLVAD
jgi:hypothetical protein